MQRDSLRRFAEAEELVEDVVWVAKRRETLAWSRVKRLGGRQTDTVERDADILCVEKTLTAVLVIEHATVSYHDDHTDNKLSINQQWRLHVED